VRGENRHRGGRFCASARKGEDDEREKEIGTERRREEGPSIAGDTRTNPFCTQSIAFVWPSDRSGRFSRAVDELADAFVSPSIAIERPTQACESPFFAIETL
jgi:hypothetical protein